MNSGIDLNLPLLRSPPFPWVAPAVRAISTVREAAAAGASEQPVEALFAAVKEARVGGAFWATPPQQRVDGAVLLAPSSAVQAQAMGEGIEGALLVGAMPASRSTARLPADTDPWSLLDGAAAVHADADHELAALAAIAGVPVRLYGKGRFGTAEGGVDVDAVAEHLVVTTSYRDPFTGGALTALEAVALLGLWRRWIDANRTVAVAAGIARWKRTTMSRFLWAPRSTPLRFTSAAPRACALAKRAGQGIAAWPSRVPPSLAAQAAAAGVRIVQVEDGFLRSVGLGSALHQPWSVVVDPRGIYYDPTVPSELERLLTETEFPAELLARARALRALIVERGVSKYGAGAPMPVLPPRQLGRRRVLVPGQVSDDLSVIRGGGGPFDAEALLARARALEPDTEIWFRPHPDVDAGFRRGHVDDAAVLRHADQVVRGGSMAELLDQVDGVHVLTSLTGFEALLRGLDVTVHGVPFYAGWGLTTDMAPVPRRGRRRSLDELVAATLILYPRYMDPVTQLPCPAEVLTARLAQAQPPAANWLTRLRGVQGKFARQAQRLRA